MASWLTGKEKRRKMKDLIAIPNFLVDDRSETSKRQETTLDKAKYSASSHDAFSGYVEHNHYAVLMTCSFLAS